MLYSFQVYNIEFQQFYSVFIKISILLISFTYSSYPMGGSLSDNLLVLSTLSWSTSFFWLQVSWRIHWIPAGTTLSLMVLLGDKSTYPGPHSPADGGLWVAICYLVEGRRLQVQFAFGSWVKSGICQPNLSFASE